MNTREALHALADGKKVRTTAWGPVKYIRYDADLDLVDENGREVRLSNIVWRGEDLRWEVVS